MFRRSLIIFALLAALAFLPSCLDEAVKPIKEPPPTTWPEMTTEDEVVQALALCYENPGLADVMTRYEDFLHSEYFFELAPDDVDVGESKFFLRDEDIASTRWIFENQSGLTLSITGSGNWDDHPEINGLTCEGCRATMRSYHIRVQFSNDGTVWSSGFGRAYATIVVAPDESDASKWVLRAIYDHGL